MTDPCIQLLSRIDQAVERCREAKVTILEDEAVEAVDPVFFDRVEAAMTEVIQLLEDVERSALDRFGAQEGDERMADSSTAIGDLTWLSIGEVGSCLSSLRGSRQEERAWQTSVAADIGLERAERALVAVESTLLEHRGLPPTDRFRFRLKESLEIRRLYGALRRTCLAAGVPKGEDLLQELWLVESQIEAIRRRKAFGLIRIDDRRQLSRLQKRVRESLADPSPVKEGDRRTLWQDLDAFSQLLMAINNREDLRAHDLELLIRAKSDLESGHGDPGDIYQRLTPLLGRDGELDKVLVDPWGQDAGAGHEILERLEIQLRHFTGFS